MTSIQDSVFEEDSPLAQEVAENSLQPIAHSLPSSQISIMEEKENEIQTLKDEMDATRKCLPVGGINHVNVDRLADVPEDLREKLMNRELKILKLKNEHKEEKTNEQWTVFVEQNKIYHEEMVYYITVLGDKIAQVKLTEREASNASNSQQQQDVVMAQRQVDNNRNYERAKSKAVGKSKQVKDDVKKAK